MRWEAATCEMIFKRKVVGPYQKNVTTELFNSWVRTRLLPTFKKHYGDEKKLVLVLDNAVITTPRLLLLLIQPK